MIKMTRFLRRVPGISHTEFVDQHVTVGAASIRSLADTDRRILRYTQSHPASGDGDIDGADYLWVESRDALEGVLSSESYRTQVQEKEEAFIDASSTLSLIGEVTDVVGDPTTEATAVAPLAEARDTFGKLPRGINHLGLTVPDLDAATEFLRAAFDAKFAYDGLTPEDDPRDGEETERQLGLPAVAKIRRQRMMQIGYGPSIEMFEIDSPVQQLPAGLADLGWNHACVYVDDIESSLQRAVAAGGDALSGTHPNSAHEDTEGNASVYVRAPWGTLFELQTIPGGHWYDDSAEVHVWTPPARG